MPKKGYKQTEDHRRKCGDARRGKKLPPRSEKHCGNISKGKKAKNKKCSESERVRYREGSLAYWNSSTGQERKNGPWPHGRTHPSYKKKTRKNCETCGRFFYVIPALIATAKYCIRKCRDKAQSRRMSGKGNIMYGTHRSGKDNPFYGKHHTKDDLRKIRLQMEKIGYWLPLDQVEPYLLYCRESHWKERMFDYLSKKELLLLNEKGLFSSKNTKGMVRDHKYSKYSGFKNKVFPIILRHPANCALITHSKNATKMRKGQLFDTGNSISLEQLFILIKSYEKGWKEQKECLAAVNKCEKGEKI